MKNKPQNFSLAGGEMQFIQKPKKLIWFTWKPNELQEFIKLYPLKSNKELAEHFKKSISAIKTKASRLNLKKAGAITIRNINDRTVYFIKTDSNTWEPLHFHIYRTQIGIIPEKHFVRFKDGNTMNLSLNNLELVNQKQNAEMNFKI